MSNWSRRNSFDASHDNPLPTTSYGLLENGAYIPTAVTPEGHLEVAIHAPRLPFGSVHVENLTPIFQIDGVYGVNSALVNTTTGLSAASDLSRPFGDTEITLQPGDVICLCVRSVTATATCVGSLNIREDQ